MAGELTGVSEKDGDGYIGYCPEVPGAWMNPTNGAVQTVPRHTDLSDHLTLHRTPRRPAATTAAPKKVLDLLPEMLALGNECLAAFAQHRAAQRQADRQRSANRPNSRAGFSRASQRNCS
jgi:hypothetical protein